MPVAADRWNHNTHYHPVILDAIPAGARRALDVGCGEGTLTRQLRRRVPEVIGVDVDPASIRAARSHPESGDITYIEGDALTCGLGGDRFDVITAVASLHHLPAASKLEWLGDRLRVGGVLAVIGLARSTWIDYPCDLAAIVPHYVRRRRHGMWHHPSPTVWPPPESYASMREIAKRVLPDARFRRRLYWRYTLVWVKP